jgi:serine protease Do
MDVFPWLFRLFTALCWRFGYFAGRTAISKDHDSRGYPLGGQIGNAMQWGNSVHLFRFLLRRHNFIIFLLIDIQSQSLDNRSSQESTMTALTVCGKSLSRFSSCFVGLCVAIFLGASCPYFAFAADPQSFANSVVKVESRVPSDAQSVENLGRARTGSGVILENQLVLTIGYLLLEADTVDIVTASGRRVPGSVAGYDHGTGFGLVRTALPISEPAIVMGDSDKVAEKQKVFTIGQGEAQATELYIVSRKVFAGSWEYLIEKPLFTFPPVNNWSGAPLLTEDGTLVGIGSLVVNDAAVDRKGVPGNMFIPTNLLKPILEDLRSKGRRGSDVQPWLGMSTEINRGNLMVQRVSPKGPADLAGIAAGDIVLGVGTLKVTDQADFYRKLWSAGKAGSEISVRLLQGGDVKDVKVKSIDRMDFIRKPSGI